MKRILSLFMCLLIMIGIVGCSDSATTDLNYDNSCDHEWELATCQQPMRCKVCWETRGGVGDHNFQRGLTCTDEGRCAYCGVSNGEVRGHDYYEGTCRDCDAKDPDFITLEDMFPGKPNALNFNMNSAGGISFYWKDYYTGKKEIHYITVTYTLYDRVGNPTQDDIRGESTSSVRLIGPFKANSTIEFYSDVFVYCDVCYKVSFDSLYFEFADGTTATVRYGWQNEVS